MGRIAVIKSLLISKLVHLFTALPNPTKKELKKWKTALLVFMGKETRPNKTSKSHPGLQPWRLNPRPAGGWGVWTPPLRFFEDSENTAALRAAGFSPTLTPIFSATFVKISTQGHVRSGHQVSSSDPTTKWLSHRATATMFQGKLWNFRNVMRSSVPTKRISRIFYIGDLRSGHVYDLPIISQWAKNQPCYIYFGASVFEWNHIV